MAGQRYSINAAVTDTTLPIGYDDALMSAGSLLLCDLNHSTRPLASGVPANAATLPNLADSVAAGVMGTTAANVQPYFSGLGSYNDGVQMKLERSGKGGLHGMCRRATAVNAGSWAAIAWPTALLNYMATNQAHNFFFCVWGYQTRAIGTSTDAPIIAQSIASSTTFKGFNWFAASDSGIPVEPTTGQLGKTRIGEAANGGMYQSVGGPGFQAAWVASDLPSDDKRNVALWGAGGLNAAGVRTDLPSWIFYGCYLEDLTVSARSFTTVDTLAQARFTADVLTNGGKYYGDSYTAPATALP